MTCWLRLRELGARPSTLFAALEHDDPSVLLALTRRPGVVVDLVLAFGADPVALLRIVHGVLSDVASATEARRWAGAGLVAFGADDRAAGRYALERVVDALDAADGELAERLRRALARTLPTSEQAIARYVAGHRSQGVTAQRVS